MLRPGIRRLLRLPPRDEADSARRVDDEIQLHLDLRIADLVRRGWSPEDARREALAGFGDGMDERDGMRQSAWRAERRTALRDWMATWAQDVRHGARQLRRNPGFTLASVLTLGLAIGANVAMFSFVDALLLRPPPHIQEPARLASVYTSDFSGPLHGTSSYPDYLDFARELAGAADLAAYTHRSAIMDHGERPEQIATVQVTGNWFRLLGVRPAAGYFFEDGTQPVAVLSWDFWQRGFGGDFGVVGRALRIDGRPFTIGGIAPDGFAGHGGRRPADVYLPLEQGAAMRVASGGTNFMEGRSSRGLLVLMRPRPNVSFEEAQSRLQAVAAGLHRQHGEAWTDVSGSPRRITVVGGRRSWVSPADHARMTTIATLLVGLVVLVLLLACSNVSNLLLVQATARRREMAVRLSLGAGRTRLMRQLVTETSLLAIAGATAGLLLALWAVSALDRVSASLPFSAAIDLRMDARVLLFSAAACVLSALLFGLAPAILASSRVPMAALRAASGSGARDHGRLRGALVAGQVAMCVLLVMTSAQLVRSLRNAVRTELGFNPAGVVTIAVPIPATYAPSAAQDFLRNASAEIAALPGVREVALSSVVPFSSGYERRLLGPQGYVARTGEDMEIDVNVVSPGWLELMDMNVARGRSLATSWSENERGIVVNQAFAERFWPGQDPLGRTVRVPDAGGDLPLEVVGVVPNAKLRELDEDSRAIVYVPLALTGERSPSLYARVSGDPEQLLVTIRERLQALDSRVPIIGGRTLQSVVDSQVLELRLAGMSFSAFGLIALAIAAIGIYGVLASAIAQRTHEIGIRIALGAEGWRVAASVAWNGMRMLLLGLVVGLGLAPVAARLFDGLLFGVSAMEPRAIALTAAVLVVIAVPAMLIPARRATRIDPILALRDA